MQGNLLLFLAPETSGEQSGATSLVSSPLCTLGTSTGSCSREAGCAACQLPTPETAGGGMR